MFKLILLTSAVMVSGAVWAQGGLFPELDGGTATAAPAEKPSAPAPSEAKPVQTPAPAKPAAAPVAMTAGQALDSRGGVVQMNLASTDDLPQLLKEQMVSSAALPGTPDKSDQKDDKKTKEEIYIIASDVTNVQPPMQGFSYCTAQFSLINKLKKQVQGVTAQLTYGTMNATLSFSAIAPDGEGKSSVTLVGDSCSMIMGLPQMEVKTCVVPGMSADECKKRVKLIPIS